MRKRDGAQDRLTFAFLVPNPKEGLPRTYFSVIILHFPRELQEIAVFITESPIVSGSAILGSR